MDEHKALLEHLVEWQKTRQYIKSTSKRNWAHWLPTLGNVIFTLALIGLLILTQNVWARGLTSSANTPGPSANTVNYQGNLANPDGTPVADGPYTLSFSLYDAASSGNVVCGERKRTPACK